jgi:hypothetical protein
MTESRLIRVVDRGAHIEDKAGKEVFVDCDRLIFAVGNRSYNALYDEIKSMGIPIFQVGDCLEPRSAKAAIYEGAVIGRGI